MSFVSLTVSEIQNSKVDQNFLGHFVSKKYNFSEGYCGYKKGFKMSFLVFILLLGYAMFGKCPKSCCLILNINIQFDKINMEFFLTKYS